jgi:putative transcriptional regulator
MQLFRKVTRMLAPKTAPADDSTTAPNETATSDRPITIAPQAVLQPAPPPMQPQGYLAGQLLVASPLIDQGVFHKAVIYVFMHSAQEGAMGIMINRPIELLNLASMLAGEDSAIETAMRDLPVYFGGPVERSRGFVLHSSDFLHETTISHSDELAVTGSGHVLEALVNGAGPRRAALIVGCAGWNAGQLESEIAQNAWITAPATESLVFNTDNDLKWVTASRSLGISNMAFYSTTVGHG